MAKKKKSNIWILIVIVLFIYFAKERVGKRAIGPSRELMITDLTDIDLSGLTVTYTEAVPECTLPADTPPCDGIIDWTEVNTAVSGWIAGLMDWNAINSIVANWISGIQPLIITFNVRSLRSQTLNITDLENANIILTFPPALSFEVNFKGGTDPNNYAGIISYGSISSVLDASKYTDKYTTVESIPFIVQPSVDEINPIISSGDTVNIIYDGGQTLIIYLPEMDGNIEWDNIFVAATGETYYDSALTNDACTYANECIGDQCTLPADTPPCDGIIDWTEVNTAVSGWIAGLMDWNAINSIVANWISG